jgi:hypothetical protein
LNNLKFFFNQFKGIFYLFYRIVFTFFNTLKSGVAFTNFFKYLIFIVPKSFFFIFELLHRNNFSSFNKRKFLNILPFSSDKLFSVNTSKYPFQKKHFFETNLENLSNFLNQKNFVLRRLNLINLFKMDKKIGNFNLWFSFVNLNYKFYIKFLFILNNMLFIRREYNFLSGLVVSDVDKIANGLSGKTVETAKIKYFNFLKFFKFTFFKKLIKNSNYTLVGFTGIEDKVNQIKNFFNFFNFFNSDLSLNNLVSYNQTTSFFIDILASLVIFYNFCDGNQNNIITFKNFFFDLSLPSIQDFKTNLFNFCFLKNLY